MALNSKLPDDIIIINDIIYIAEYKTSNKQYFNKIKKYGIENTFPKYYAQICCYMGMSGIHNTFFYVVCKDNDDRHFETFSFDDEAECNYDMCISKAESIIWAQAPPLRIWENESWYQCKICEYKNLCYGNEKYLRNCRTCVYSEPYKLINNNKKSTWYCGKLRDLLTTKVQKVMYCELGNYNFYEPIEK